MIFLKPLILEAVSDGGGVLYAKLKKPTISEKDVDPEEFKLGIKEEFEHTDDESAAKIIALHHLSEDPHYYSKLKKAMKS